MEISFTIYSSKNNMKHNTFAFSLIELLVWILIVSFIVLAGFQSLSAVGIAKIKLIEKTRIEKEAYYASERFFELIKKWGTIDYEEYWNRSSFDQEYASGHFKNQSGFWNFGVGGIIESSTFGGWLYFCESENRVSMGVNGCLSAFNNPSADYEGSFQRYGQYALQFIDHNSDFDASGDEDWDGKIVGDADDLYLWIWPDAFLEWQNITELYLINTEWNERTYFRWSIQTDPDNPSWWICNTELRPLWQECRWTIEFLKLIGSDSWYNHLNNGWAWDNDGLVDTWNIHPDFTGTWLPIIAWTTTADYWQPIFSDTIHVSRAEFFLYPNKDLLSSWRDTSESIKVSPYLQLRLTLEPSWKERRKIRWLSPETTIRSTVQLLDIDLQ